MSRSSTPLPLQLALITALALGACAGPSEPAQRIKAGDAELYASYVQPYVEVGCATLDCHGDPGRALRLYSELGLRKGAELRPSALSDAVDPLAITDAELDDNRRAFAGVALATDGPKEHLALLKPLASSAGGIHHVGPTLWPSTDAPGYQCLRAYLAGDADADPADACAQALDDLDHLAR
jgi:hypothetical protein